MTNLTQAQKIESIVANNGSDAGTDAIQYMVRYIEDGILEEGLRSHPVKIGQTVAEIVGEEIQAEVPAHVIEFGVKFAYSMKAAVVAQNIVQKTLMKARPEISYRETFDFLTALSMQDDLHNAATPIEERTQSILEAAEVARGEGEGVYERSVEYLEANARNDMDLRLLDAALFDLIVDVEYEKLQLPATHMNASEFMS